MKSNHLLLIAGCLLLFSSCSTVKHLPPGEVYYKGFWNVEYDKVKVPGKPWKVHDYGDKAVDGFLSLYVTPNGSLLGLPMMRVFLIRLWFYNLFYTKKEKGINRWLMENLGEPPKTITGVNPGLRVKKVENMLENMGHFGTKGTYRLIYNKKYNKARVRYSFLIPRAYTYRSIELNTDTVHAAFNTAMTEYLQQGLLQPSSDFSLTDIADEKLGLFEHLRNIGYYGLKSHDILMLADTTVGGKKADVRIMIDPEAGSEPYKKYYVNGVKVKIDTVMKADLIPDGAIVQGKSSRVKEKIIATLIDIPLQSPYSLNKTRQTITNLSRAGIFSETIINYHPLTPSDSLRLRAEVELRSNDRFSLNLDGDIGMKSTGFIGPSVDLTATQRNIFGGAENLSLRLAGFLDFPIGVYKERVSNTYGSSSTISLTSPVSHPPFKGISRTVVGVPQRDLSLSYDYIVRPDLFRFVNWNASYGLLWQTHKSVRHRFDMVNFTYTAVPQKTAIFDTLLARSPQAKLSYSEQFILGSAYSFTIDNRWNKRRQLTHYYSGGIELAGNILNLAAKLTKSELEILGVKYSQYLILKSELRLFKKLGQRGNILAFRNITNFGIPIGNSRHMPFVRQFYVGGTNSMRPFSARTLGPGRYVEFNPQAVNQVADIKIETNLEYRFRIVYLLYGAVWSDLGNIWLLREDPTRRHSGFRPGMILPDSYLTSGIGLRLDLTYLVLRADYGAVMYLPVLEKGLRWIWQLPVPITNVMGLSFGIGYPF